MSGHLDLYIPEWQGYGKHRAVADGASALRAQLCPPLSFTDVPVPENETLEVEHGVLGYHSNLQMLRAARESIEAKDPETIFLIGGTCASEIAPVSFLNKRYDGDLAVLWFDAHGDLNTPESSTSKRLHGMPLRMLLGDGPQAFTSLAFSQLMRSQVILAGSRDLDPPEVSYVQSQGIRCIPAAALIEWNELAGAVHAIGSRNLYVHLDLDVLDPEDFPHVLIPTPGGIGFDDLLKVLRVLGDEFRIVGSSIVEYVPVGKGDPERMERLVTTLRAA